MRIGNGRRIRFWTNQLCGSSVFSLTFPVLFELVVNKQEIVVEVWEQRTYQGSWYLKFVRDFNDWELDLVVNLLSALLKESVSSKMDKVTWKWAKGDDFSMLEAYSPWKGIWVSSTPIKTTFLHEKHLRARFSPLISYRGGVGNFKKMLSLWLPRRENSSLIIALSYR